MSCRTYIFQSMTSCVKEYFSSPVTGDINSFRNYSKPLATHESHLLIYVYFKVNIWKFKKEHQNRTHLCQDSLALWETLKYIVLWSLSGLKMCSKWLNLVKKVLQVLYVFSLVWFRDMVNKRNKHSFKAIDAKKTYAWSAPFEGAIKSC